METINTILVYGTLLAALLTLIILLSLYISPRIWLQDLPREMQAIVPPKTKKEKLQTLVLSFIFALVLLVLPVVAILNNASTLTLIETWITAYFILLFFNLADLLIIDWLVICTLTPGFILVNGIDKKVYKNYTKHLTDFAKGCIGLALLAILTGSFAYFIY